MARAKTVWGIDIGQCALKALKLRDIEGRLQVEALDIIEHPKILSEPDADREQLIKDALQQFLANVSLAGSEVVISVPGQSTFSRFVKLPPVESKRVPDIVRFEAEQQIPFPINEVIWRWQTFRDPDSPDVEVGIFAMKRSDVAEMLHHFNEADLRVDVVQMAPLALYNFMTFDEQLTDEGATLLADVGADKTDLVVADKGRIWTRTIQIGGNNFTEALVKTFKLPFDKAEKLKRTAHTSKYARQIFQSMRPVFADLVQEIQRSIGFYTSLHRETRFRKLLGLGNGFRLPGLQKFIEQNLNVPVTRIDSYNKLAPSPTVNAPALNENVLSFAVAYGLAIQGLQRANVATNLLPDEIVRKRLWDRKRPWFAAAVVAVLAALFCPGYRANLDSKILQKQADLGVAEKVLRELNNRIKEWNKIHGEGEAEERQVKHLASLFGNRDYWPAAMTLIYRSIEAVAPNQPLLMDYGRYMELKELYGKEFEEITAGKDEKGQNVPEGDLDTAASILLNDEAQRNFRRRVTAASPRALRALAGTLITKTKAALDPTAVAALSDEDLRCHVKRLLLLEKVRDVEAFKSADRKTRRVLIMENLSCTYLPDLAGRRSALGGDQPPSGKRGFRVEMVARVPLPQSAANKMAADLRQYSSALVRWISSLSVDSHQVEWLPTARDYRSVKPATAGGPVMPDPLMPDEEAAGDTRFKIIWLITVEGNGIVMGDVKVGRKYTLSKEAELVPELDPADALAAAQRIQGLPPETVLTVEDVQTKWTVPWYRVRAADASGKTLGTGWLSGWALEVKEVKEGAESR